MVGVGNLTADAQEFVEGCASEIMVISQRLTRDAEQEIVSFDMAKNFVEKATEAVDQIVSYLQAINQGVANAGGHRGTIVVGKSPPPS